MDDSLKSLVDLFLALLQLFKAFWPVWLVLGLPLLLGLSLKFYKSYRLSKSGMRELDKLGGEDFEKYLELLFRKLGYKVRRTPYQGDYGADLVIQKAGVQTVVQAKRYHRSVGVKAVQEAVAAKEVYKCGQAMVVTNSHYSQQARKLAKANKVQLWDRDDLVNVLLSVKKLPAEADTSNQTPAGKDAPVPEPAPVSSPTLTCVMCGKSVSPQVSSYCLNHQDVFGGKIYCYEHQKAIRHKAATGS